MPAPGGNGKRQSGEFVVQIDSAMTYSDFGSHPDCRRLIGRLVDVMIHEALVMGASEIRLDRLDDRVNMRYRVNDAWQQQDSPPARLWHLILAQLHTLANREPSQPLLDHIVIDRDPATMAGSKSGCDKYPTTLRLEVEKNVVTLIVQ